MTRQSETNFEKTALSVLAAVIIAVLGWVGLTVNQNQIQYARIDERLSSQSDMLKDVKKTMVDANTWRTGVNQDINDIKARLYKLEQAK